MFCSKQSEFCHTIARLYVCRLSYDTYVKKQQINPFFHGKRQNIYFCLFFRSSVMMFPHHGSLQKGYVYCKKKKKNQAIYKCISHCYFVIHNLTMDRTNTRASCLKKVPFLYVTENLQYLTCYEWSIVTVANQTILTLIIKPLFLWQSMYLSHCHFCTYKINYFIIMTKILLT